MPFVPSVYRYFVKQKAKDDIGAVDTVNIWYNIPKQPYTDRPGLRIRAGQLVKGTENKKMVNLEKRMRHMAVHKRAAWILLAMALVRIGTSIPLPFVNPLYMQALFGDNTGFLTMMMGDSMERMSVFALSITPYITASIIVQLMTVAIPKLEEIRKDGALGEKRYKRIISGTGIVLAIAQSAAMAVGFGKQGLIEPYTWWTVLLCTSIWITGACLLIWLGNFLEKFGLGSGISMLLLCNIVVGVPGDCIRLYELFLAGKSLPIKALNAALILLVTAMILLASVTLVTSIRNIPITSSRRTTGHLEQQYFPIPFVTCSVMPIIFAGSLVSMPQILSGFLPAMQEGIWPHIIRFLSPSYWADTTQPIYSLGILVYAALTYIFTRFYVEVEYNPVALAENLKTKGIMIPGIRPGKPTAQYLKTVITETAIAGNWCLTGMVIASYVIANLAGIGSVSLSGTSAVIAVSVVNDLYQRLEVERNSGMKRKSAAGGFFVRRVPGRIRKGRRFFARIQRG